MRVSKQDKQRALEMLHKFLKPGDKVYTVLRSVSSSGMSRQIDLYTFHDGEKVYLTGYASQVLEWSRNDKTGALRVSGCGMDMGFHTVYCLSRCMFPEGFDTSYAGRECYNPAQHETTFRGDGRAFTCPHCGRATVASYRRNGPCEFDPDGGYALNQEWI